MSINIINSKTHAQLKFKDFTMLKVGGKDQYSRFQGDAIKMSLGADVYNQLLTEFEGDIKSANSCGRWMLRGLTQDKAVRKVKTDLEVGKNCYSPTADEVEMYNGKDPYFND